MRSGFVGFPEEGFRFLAQLKKNNDREWFTPRKEEYERHLKLPMMALIDALNGELSSFAPDYLTEPKKAVYRIYRDTRFSKDKTPYKTHAAAGLFRNGTRKDVTADFYFSVAPDRIEVAGGVYMPSPDQLLAIRNHIAANFEEFDKITCSRAAKKLVGDLRGEELTRPPKGFSPDDPAIRWLRRKQWYYYDTALDPTTALTDKLLPELVKRLKVMTPMVSFLNRALAPKISARDFLF